MGRYILLFVVSFLFLSLSIGGFLLYHYATLGSKIQNQDLVSSIKDDAKSSVDDPNNWLKELSQLGKKDYVLPVNEISIEYSDLKPKENVKIAYELMIDKHDLYSLFCLRQTLKNIDVDFTIVRDGVKSQIFLNTQDRGKLEKIMTDLKAYDIHSSVMEVRL